MRNGLMPGSTFSMASTDTAQGLTAASILGSGGNPCAGALITFETNDIRYAFNDVDPTQAGTGHLADVSVGVGCELWIEGGKTVKSFKFISAGAGTHGVVTCTPFFESGKV